MSDDSEKTEAEDSLEEQATAQELLENGEEKKEPLSLEVEVPFEAFR